MTKQNPRPRKYASDAEKQAAYRARAAEVCVRLEPKTMATLDSIAEEIGYSRNELMQSMVKFGLTNRDWRNEGLTAHKRLPRYQENPGMATKPPSAAQLAARARFAEMARNGSLNRKRQIAAKRKATPVRVDLDAWMQEYKNLEYENSHSENLVRLAELVGNNADIKLAKTLLKNRDARGYLDDADFRLQYELNKKLWPKLQKMLVSAGRESNPAKRKKTVSQKISQLVHEGYPQRQAVAVALNEERAGKVKSNPSKSKYAGFKYCVESHRYDDVWLPIAYFANKIQADDYINALKKSHPRQMLRIKTHK